MTILYKDDDDEYYDGAWTIRRWRDRVVATHHCRWSRALTGVRMSADWSDYSNFFYDPLDPADYDEEEAAEWHNDLVQVILEDVQEAYQDICQSGGPRRGQTSGNFCGKWRVTCAGYKIP